LGLLTIIHVFDFFQRGRGQEIFDRFTAIIGNDVAMSGILLGGKDYVDWVESHGKFKITGLGRLLRN